MLLAVAGMRRSAREDNEAVLIGNVALYWHLVDVIWVCFHPALYLPARGAPGILRPILVWAALQLLLVATMAGSLLPPGVLRLLLGYGIAAMKAGLILWFFMEMRLEGAVARFATLAAGLWLLILLTLMGADYATLALSDG